MRRFARHALIAIIIWSLSVPAAPALLGLGELSDTLVDLVEGTTGSLLVPVIVQTDGRPTSSDLLLVKLLGGITGKVFTSIDAFPALVPLDGLLELASSPRVTRISRDWQVRPLADSASPYSGAVQAWQELGLTGAGIGVAFIDSGLNESADLSSSGRRIVHVDFASNIVTSLLGSLLDPRRNDGFGHGTHVAGILGGSGAASSGPGAFRTFRGVAPGATLISLRALDGAGMGTTSTILRAIDWALANRSSYNLRVLNLSLGHPIDESYRTDPLCRAVEAAWRAGIVVVVAAGNYGDQGYASILSPANDPYVITVGAAADRNTLSRDDDAVASFSSMGPTSLDGILKPDLVASGIQVVSSRASGSTLDAAYPSTRIAYSFYLSGGSELPSPYAAYSGTSMSAPVVAGAAALMLQKDPRLNPDTVKARLMVSAHPILDDVVRTGAGMLDIVAALGRSDARRPMTAMSPWVAAPEGEDGSAAVLDPAHLYGATLDPSVAGQIAIWGRSTQWGQIAIWGRTNSAQIAIWGTRAQTGGSVLTAAE
ncbi:MAG TPA: S8 family peptidase [Candidatus Polarisedimenticolia bacterium]|nr:S8 family peptidase [Candidatus Polarisedimenticolia bacterium]